MANRPRILMAVAGAIMLLNVVSGPEHAASERQSVAVFTAQPYVQKATADDGCAGYYLGNSATGGA
jgi:hypothetical protein